MAKPSPPYSAMALPHRPDTNIVHIQTDSPSGRIWTQWKPLPRSQHQLQPTQTTSTTLPPNAIPITTNPSRHQRLTKSSYVSKLPATTPTTNETHTVRSYIQQLPAHEKWVLGHIQSIPASDLSSLLQAIKSDDIAIGSDGSVKQHQASYSARLQSITNPHAFATLHSLGSHMPSTRAEAFGYLAALYLLRLLIQFHNVLFTGDSSNIDVYIDNQGVLKRLSYRADYSIGHVLATNSNLLRKIRNTETSLPFTFNRHHVKSHQFDSENDLTKIPLPNLLNKQCNMIAKAAYRCSTCLNQAK